MTGSWGVTTPSTLPPGLPTGVKPDAVTGTHVVLIKGCRTLRLTHQIRLAAFMAQTQSKRLLLVVREQCSLSDDLERFVADNRLLIEVRRG